MRNIALQRDSSAEQAARQILFGLIGVFKKLNLYSGSHSVYQSALDILKKLLDDHFERYGNFRLDVKRGNFLYRGTLLYEGSAEPTDPAFLLHRDGILWIEFEEGVQLWEIDTFVKILNSHRVLDEDPEDDIVTALWAVNLPAVQYEAADLELGLQDDIHIADLPCADYRHGDAGQSGGGQGRCETHYSDFANNVLMCEGQDQLWELTNDEQEQLRQMIAAEEQLDGSDYAIDALMYILEEHCLEEDITELLDTLLQELYEALVNARFSYLLETVMRLKKGVLKNNPQANRLAPRLGQFTSNLGSGSFLNGLLQIPAYKLNDKDGQLKNLKAFLLQLEPWTIDTLGPMMLKTQSEALQRILLEVIDRMARCDFRPLENIIAQAEPILAGRLVFVLGFLKDTRSRHILSSLLSHPSALVRRPALKALLQRDDQAIDEIFPLINDADEEISKRVLNRLGRRRSARIEHKLLDYLDKHGHELKNGECFIAVCRALGRCGSERSLPYLTGLLFKWPLIGVLRSVSSMQRQGAIAALNALNTREAARLMDRHSRGFLGNILRSANSHSI